MCRAAPVVLVAAVATGLGVLIARSAASAGSERQVWVPTAGTSGPVLEGMLAIPGGGKPAPGVVICHPNPRSGGSMDNPIIKDLRVVFSRADFATLRFNFRGVGRSTGGFTDGTGEVDDVLGALVFLRRQTGVDPGRVSVVGYSFGAAMALQASVRDGTVAACACLGFPARSSDDVVSSVYFGQIAFPTIFVAGTEDPVCRLDALAKILRTYSAEKLCRIEPVPGADHFLAGVGQRGIALKHIVRFVKEASAARVPRDR